MAKVKGWTGPKNSKGRDEASNGTLEGWIRDFAAEGGKDRAVSVLAGLTSARDARLGWKGRAKGKAKAKAKAKAKGEGKAN